MSLSTPYIVSSRSDAKLKKTLLKDDYPILMEGIHCSGLLNDVRFRKRFTILRLHNVEHKYYRQLFRTTASFFKKIYYLFESGLLLKYERNIASKPSLVLSVSVQDANVYRNLHSPDVRVLPVFTGFQLNLPGGTGTFCLYHGNLSVPENEKAAIWLLENVFNDFNIPFIVAGRHPSSQLASIINGNKNASLVADPTDAELKDLISAAQCNILPSFNSTGIKLKVIHVLFHGKHCLVNTAAVCGSGVESLCAICESPADFKHSVLKHMGRPLTASELESRKSTLENIFDDRKNAETLIGLIW
jgi:hypothetical protein